MSRMNPTRRRGCLGRRRPYERIEKMPGVSLGNHLERIHTFIQGRLLGTSNDSLRFDHNQALFFLKTLSSDPLWCYRIKELHPKNRLYHFAGGCSLCEWEPTGMDMDGLVDRPIDIGP